MNNTVTETSCCIKLAQQEVFKKYNEILQQDDFNQLEYNKLTRTPKKGDITLKGYIAKEDAEVILTLISEGITTLDAAQQYFYDNNLDYNAYAADVNGDGIIDSNDYQEIIDQLTAKFYILDEGGDILSAVTPYHETSGDMTLESDGSYSYVVDSVKDFGKPFTIVIPSSYGIDNTISSLLKTNNLTADRARIEVMLDLEEDLEIDENFILKLIEL